MTLLNPITAYVIGATESIMTDAEAVYTAQEAADKLATTLAMLRERLDGIGDMPISDVNRQHDLLMGHVNLGDHFLAEIRSALSNIKVRETA